MKAGPTTASRASVFCQPCGCGSSIEILSGLGRQVKCVNAMRLGEQAVCAPHPGTGGRVCFTPVVVHPANAYGWPAVSPVLISALRGQQPANHVCKPWQSLPQTPGA